MVARPECAPMTRIVTRIAVERRSVIQISSSLVAETGAEELVAVVVDRDRAVGAAERKRVVHARYRKGARGLGRVVNGQHDRARCSLGGGLRRCLFRGGAKEKTKDGTGHEGQQLVFHHRSPKQLNNGQIKVWTA